MIQQASKLAFCRRRRQPTSTTIESPRDISTSPARPPGPTHVTAAPSRRQSRRTNSRQRHGLPTQMSKTWQQQSSAIHNGASLPEHRLIQYNYVPFNNPDILRTPNTPINRYNHGPTLIDTNNQNYDSLQSERYTRMRCLSSLFRSSVLSRVTTYI
jgi:hypothetical protein